MSILNKYYCDHDYISIFILAYSCLIKNIAELPQMLFLSLQEITFAIFGGFLCVRSQNKGFERCPIHLDYYQMADKCISHGFTWFHMVSISKPIQSYLSTFLLYVLALSMDWLPLKTLILTPNM